MDQLARFRTNLATIADCYAQLAAADHAAVTGTTGVRVGGSTEPKLPINADHVDLTSEARRGSLDVADSSPWAEDQVGHHAVATELDFWVRDIADLCGEKLPMPTVPVLAMWLHERAGWAWDYYGALDEMVVTVDRISRTLWAIVNPRAPRPEQKAAPCPGCGEATLLGADERVWCTVEDCGRVLTEGEYVEWARSVIVRETMGGEAMTAAAIAIQYGRTKENVHWLAHKHGWKRSDGKQRPVLYLATDVVATMATLRTRRPAQLDSDMISKG